MDVNILRTALLECYHKYGQKFIMVLKTALAIAKENRLKGGQLPGDFDYRTLVDRLNSMDFQYNPSLLLRTLEREYNIIETSYRSSNQHWYKFRDLESIEQILNSIIGMDSVNEEPEVSMVKIQIKALQIRYWLSKLKSISIKSRLTKSDIELFRRFSFSILPKLVKILRKAEEYEEQLYTEINIIKEAISIAQIVAERINQEELYTVRHHINRVETIIEDS